MLPYEILEGMIQCFGRAFHFKDAMAAFFLNAGVPRQLVDRYRNDPKFVWARNVLSELGSTEQGQLVQRRLLTELCRLRDVPDPNVPDRDAAISALRDLKTRAVQLELVSQERSGTVATRKNKEAEFQRVHAERAQKLEDVRKRFAEAVVSTNRQSAGYSLEDVLVELFALFEMDYRKSYRTPTQQIDGHFNLDGFDYLVEAKWRSDQPPEQEIGGFRQKVDSKLESTRGLFISVPGFRQEVINQFNGRGAKILLMDGMDLTEVLEGRFHLRDGLRRKISRAAQEGQVFTSLRS